jgi:hypothetical protein
VQLLRVISSPDGLRRVEIFQRDSGTCGFRAFQWDPTESSWIPGGRFSESFTESAEAASAEACERVSWLAQLRPDSVASLSADALQSASDVPYPKNLRPNQISPSLIALVRDIARRLVDGPTASHDVLRTQLNASNVSGITLTGAGLFADFAVPSDQTRVFPATMIGGEVLLDVAGLDAPAGSLIKVEDGQLRFLEVYTYGNRPWPDMPLDVTFGTSIPLPIGPPAT